MSAIATLAIIAAFGAATADVRAQHPGTPPAQSPPAQTPATSPSPAPAGQAGSAATVVRDALLDVAGDMQYYGAGIGVVGVIAMAGPGVLKPAGACVAAGGAFIAMGGMFLDRTVKQLFPGQRSVRAVAALRRATRQRIRVPRRLRGVAAAVRALRDHSGQVEDAALRLTTAVDAAASAQTDQARLSALDAAADEADSLADLLDAAPALRQRFAAALSAARVRLALNAGQLDALDRTIATRGLPPRLVVALRRFGAPESWIAEYDAAARSAGPVAPQLGQVQQGPADITRLLRDPALTAEQQDTANALRGLAAALSPAG